MLRGKNLIWLGAIVGSFLGAYVPKLWGASAFSMSAVLFSGLGGLAGIWAGYKLSQLV